MTFKEFTEVVVEEISEKINYKGLVEIHNIKKNNDVELHGLSIYANNRNISPTIYLEPFYELYKKDVPLDLLIDKIWSIYEENIPKVNVDMMFFMNFDQIKDKIFYRLVHAERNKELLTDVPHILIWDLAICFCYACSLEGVGDGMILIHNAQMENWNVNTQTLMQLAEVNTPRLFPMCFQGMQEILKQMDFEFDLYECEEEQLYVLSNTTRTYGASVILYPETLAYVAEKLQCDFYILPSSVHEVIVLKKERYDILQNEGKRMHEMIKSINQEQLSAEEVLTDYPFYYDCFEAKLCQLI